MNNSKMDYYIAEYTHLWHEENDIYYAYAKAYGLSITTLCVLYFIYLNQDSCTQKEISESGYVTKQAVNLSVTSLLKQGYVTLSESASDRRVKIIRFTDTGRKFADGIIPGLLNAERAAIGHIGEKCCEELIRSTKLYLSVLRQSVLGAIEQSKL